MTTVTRRVTVSPAADHTKRVPTSGANPAIPASFGLGAWGDTWSGFWGNTWKSVTMGTAAIPASPAIDVTARVGEAAVAANHTKRVTEAVA